MSKKLVFNAKDVVGFSPAGYEDSYVSRLLIDPESVGSQRLVLNFFTLSPGKNTEPGSHPAPFDEIYYILRGRGILYLNASRDTYNLESDTVAFIPSGTIHWLLNPGTTDLEMITIMPGPLAEGANPLYDDRKRRWGSSFKLAEKSGLESRTPLPVLRAEPPFGPSPTMSTRARERVST